MYIAASPQNVEIFQLGRIVGRDDDNEHFGIIESMKIETDAENGDYLTISGRFLTCLLERRIIYPTFSANNTYENIVRNVLSRNAICETIGGSVNIRLNGNSLKCDLFEGTDRSILQDTNPHIVFSNSYNNLLSFFYVADNSKQKNFAYVLGSGEGAARKRITYFSGTEPTYLDRYEVYVDERNTSQDEDVTDDEYLEILKNSGAENMIIPQTASESTIAAFSTQYQYNHRLFCRRLCDGETHKIWLDSAENTAYRYDRKL